MLGDIIAMAMTLIDGRVLQYCILYTSHFINVPKKQIFAMEDEPVMSILSGIVVPTEAVVGSQSRFYDDVQPDHHKAPVFAMLDRFTNEMVDDRYFPGPIPIITYDNLPAV